jgi:hypothetical protein
MLGGLGAGGGKQPICVIGLRTAQLRFIPANLFCIVLYAFNLRTWRKAEISGPASPKMPRPRSNISRPVQSRRARWVRAELFNRRPQSGTDGEEAAAGGKCNGGAVGVRVGSGTPYRARCGGGSAVGAGGNRYTVQRKLRGRPSERRQVGTVRSTTLETLDEQNRCQVGPHSLRPPPGSSPAGLHQSILVPTMDTSNDDAQRTVPHESCISFRRAAARSWALSSQHPCWI